MKKNPASKSPAAKISGIMPGYLKQTALPAALLAFMCCSCGSEAQKQGNMHKVSQMPPSVTAGKVYLSIDPALLASGKDLVCNMGIKNKTVDTALYKGKIYGFCGTGCKEAFAAEPLTYINSAN